MLNPDNHVTFGTDPEGFFAKDGQIIGSEKLIPIAGLETNAGKIVRDGVQFELNPRSNGTVLGLAQNIGTLFARLAQAVAEVPGVSVCFDGLVEVSREELDSLSPECQVLGCNPSYNVYGDKPINVDPYTYQKRSSGGHIHLGLPKDGALMQRGNRRLVPVLDVLVGNTAVLLDRDPGCAERRENYGRAGECRFPSHGLEYRTTSNFWLRDYSLMSFAFGMAQLAYVLTEQGLSGNTAMWEDFTKRVSIKNITKAIDTNDFGLAMRNFKKLVPFLRKHLPAQGFPLTPKNIPAFIGLAEDIERRGANAIFPEDQIIRNWVRNNFVEFGDFITQR